MKLLTCPTSNMPTPAVMTIACCPVLSRFLLMKCFSKVLREMLSTSKKFPWAAVDNVAVGIVSPGLV